MTNRAMYTVSFENVAVTAANGDHDYFEVQPAVGKGFVVCGLFVATTTEVGDAQEEQVRYEVLRMTGGTLTSGNGTATTPRPVDEGAGASILTAETVGSTVATTTGTSVIMHADTFNIRTGLQLWLPPEARWQVNGVAQSALVVRQMAALADDASMSGTLYVMEL